MKNTTQQGFTLLELMVTIAIVGILASIAFWDSSDRLQQDRAESHLLELKRNLSFARTKATTTDSLVVVCNGDSSQLKNNNSSITCQDNWSNGSTFVFYDSNNNGIYDPTQGDKILRVMNELPDNNKLTFAADSQVIFDSSGRLTTSTGTFIYCPSNQNDNNKALTLSLSGNALYNGDTTLKCD